MLQDNLTQLDDFRIDTSSDTVDITQEGLRAINFIIKDLKLKHKWPFVIRKSVINYYTDIREYAAPINYDDMIGLFDQMNYLDPFDRIKPIEFNRRMNLNASENIVADEFRDGGTILKINFNNTKSQSTLLINNESYDGNGTWVSSGTASNVESDAHVYFSGVGCVRFESTGVGTSILTNLTLSAVDLSSLKSNYGVFFKLFVQNGSLITGATLRWGNDALNYHSVSITKNFNNESFRDGLNQLGFESHNTTDTGTVDDSSIDYVVLNITHSASLGKVYLNRMDAITPDPLEFEYYSSDWANNGGTWKSSFDGASTPSTDYGAWEGRYQEFDNLINLGASWRVCDIMQDDDRSKRFKIDYQGDDTMSGKGGLLGNMMKIWPSRVKKLQMPVITIGGRGISDYIE